jgi:hypothetical protein
LSFIYHVQDNIDARIAFDKNFSTYIIIDCMYVCLKALSR